MKLAHFMSRSLYVPSIFYALIYFLAFSASAYAVKVITSEPGWPAHQAHRFRVATQVIAASAVVLYIAYQALVWARASRWGEPLIVASAIRDFIHIVLVLEFGRRIAQHDGNTKWVLHWGRIIRMVWMLAAVAFVEPFILALLPAYGKLVFMGMQAILSIIYLFMLIVGLRALASPFNDRRNA